MFSQLADYVSGAWWSYPLVLGLAYADVLLPLVPSETAVITGGVLASSGDMHLSLLILGAALGAIGGDNTAYLLGRFIPGGRTVVTLAAGSLEMPWRRFIAFDVLAGAIWASYAAGLGYFGGKAFERAPWKGLLVAFGIALAVTGCVEGVRWLRRRLNASPTAGRPG